MTTPKLLAFHGDPKLKEDLVANRVSKATRSLMIVRDYLVRHGFTVAKLNHPNANGVDIAVTGRAWRVSKFHNVTDYVAIVMPDSSVHFDTFQDHAALCSKDGSRRITGLVNLYAMMATELLQEAK